MIVLDTSVLVYAVGDAHPLKVPCQGLIGLIMQGALEATTTPEVIQEFVHVRSRRRSRENAVGFARDFAGLLQPLTLVEDTDLRAGLEIFEQVPEIGSFDAVLAAVARRIGATRLVSADRRFGSVLGLAWEQPNAFWERVR